MALPRNRLMFISVSRTVENIDSIGLVEWSVFPSNSVILSLWMVSSSFIAFRRESAAEALMRRSYFSNRFSSLLASLNWKQSMARRNQDLASGQYFFGKCRMMFHDIWIVHRCKSSFFPNQFRKFVWMKNEQRHTVSDLVFGRCDYKKITHKTFQKILRKAAIPNKQKPRRSFHTLRHAFASEYMKNGGSCYQL